MVTTNCLTNLNQLAEEMGVLVRTAPTPSAHWGIYDHRIRLVTIRPGLGPIQYQCTLAHELGHAHYGHVGASGKQELMADRWAARRLLRFEDVLAEAGTDRHEHEVAASLGVLPSVLEAFRMTLTESEEAEMRAMALLLAAQ